LQLQCLPQALADVTRLLARRRVLLEKEMTDYTICIEELLRRIDERKENLRAQEASVVKACGQLQSLLDCMRSHVSIFDDEDRDRVSQEIALHQQKIQSIRDEGLVQDAQRTEKETLFKAMLNAITQRTQVLEQEDELLLEHPDMLKYFARKQLSLRKLLESKIAQTLGSP
jgi:hypothetical protein